MLRASGTYLVVLDFLGNSHIDGEQLVETTDEGISYGVEDKLVA